MRYQDSIDPETLPPLGLRARHALARIAPSASDTPDLRPARTRPYRVTRRKATLRDHRRHSPTTA